MTDDRKKSAIRGKVSELLRKLANEPKHELETLLKGAMPLTRELGKNCSQLSDLLTVSLAFLELRMRYQLNDNLVEKITSELCSYPRPIRVFVPVSNVGKMKSGWHALPHGFGVLQLPEYEEDLQCVPESFQKLLVDTVGSANIGGSDPLSNVRKRYMRGQRFLSATSDGIPLRLVNKLSIGDATDRIKFWIIFGSIFLHFRCEPKGALSLSAEGNQDLFVSVYDEKNDLMFDGEQNSLNEAALFSNVEVVAEGIEGRFKGFENHFGQAFNTDGSIKPDFEGIFSAALWLFDARAESNETVAFLNSCIGLESILGDQNKESITERLSDRCAYLLAGTAEARSKVRNEVRSLYEIRSKIVHGRRRRLQNHGELDNARKLLFRVLQAEVFNYLKHKGQEARLAKP